MLAGSPARNVLILPLNTVAVMPEELEPLGPVVWNELERHLESPGRHLRTVAPEVARRFWIASVQQVRSEQGGAEAGFPEASRALVARLAPHVEFDTVIVPSLFVRQARVEGRVAHWDGVERPVEVGTSRAERDLAGGIELEGLAPAASFHAVVLDADGEELQRGMGGIDLLSRVRVARQPATGEPVFEYEARPDAFSNLAHVREAIALALDPLFPPPPADR